MKQKNNIWWKLAFASALVDVLAMPVWIGSHFGCVPRFMPIPAMPLVLALLALPVVYLLIFVLWHWRTRYAGRHHLAWPILFVVTSWPLFSTLPGSVFTALAYCALHLVPDARGKGAYACEVAPLTLSPPATPLPKGYQLAKSACFVVGWALVIVGLVAAATTCVLDFMIWNVFEQTLPNQIGKEFTKAVSSTLWGAGQIAKVTGLTSLLAVVAATVGAILIQVSQRLRWRLLDEMEKEELKKII